MSRFERLTRFLLVSAVAALTLPILAGPVHAEEIGATTAPTCKEVLASWGLITIGNDGSIAENITMDGQAPYEVSTINQLYCIGAGSFVVETDGSNNDTISNTGVDCRSLNHDAVLVEMMHARYIQTADLDFADLTVDNATHWRPIGNNGCQFMGEYDGNSKKISNLYFNQPTLSSNNRPYEGIGLFGSTGDNTYAPAGTTRTRAVIKNVVLEDVTIYGLQDVGGIVGIADRYTEINNVSVSGTIGVSQLGYGDLGGIVGWANGEPNKRVIVRNSDADVTFEVIAPGSPSTNIPWCTGGIMGYANDAEIYDSTASITMINEVMSGIAGIVGCLYTGAIEGSFSAGTIDNRNQTPAVEDVAGIVSYVQNASITDSYSVVAAANDTNVGGLVTWADNATLTRTYAATPISTSSNTTVGGLIALQWNATNNTVQSSFWDTTISNVTTSEDGGTGKNTADLKMLSTYTAAGWDIVNAFDSSKVWGLCAEVNNGYPFLQAQTPTGSTCTQGTPSGTPGNTPTNNNAPSNAQAPTIQEQIKNRKWMEGLSNDEFSRLTSTDLSALSINAIRGITKKHAEVMTRAQLLALTPAQIRVVRPSTLAALPAEWLSQLSANQITYLLPRQIRVLSEQQLQKFTAKQRSVITSVLRKAVKQSDHK